jgi:glyoxylase-like metal-dependent hydrolase (beta-lactamase superfamily II)
MSRPEIIDTNMHGRPGITGCFVVRGERNALVESGPKTSASSVLEGLDRLGIETLDWIVVTHIHLDHAGGAGTLLKRFPEAKVAVHPIGAPHLADPSKLWNSASRIYGDQMETMWGGMDPIPLEKIHVVNDGDQIDLGGRKLTAIETPGHASHHHAYLDDATGVLFAGDAVAVRLPEVGVIRPASPPPEFNVEVACASIERIRALGPSSVWLTHYGPADQGTRPLTPDELCDAAIEALRTWETWVLEARRSSDDLDDVAAYLRTKTKESVGDQLDEAAVDRMEQTTSYRMNAMGYIRYLDKKQQSEAAG